MTQDILSPEDTGEIVHGGEWRRPDRGDKTVVIRPFTNHGYHLTRRPYADERLATTAEIHIPQTIGIVEPYAQPYLPAANLNTTERITLLGALGGEPETEPQVKLRRSVPYTPPQDRRPPIKGAHRTGWSGAWRRMVLRWLGVR